MNSDKSFFERLQDGRGEQLDACPYCGNTTEVYETPQGLIDCYRCGTHQTRTQTILRGEGDSREPITIKAEEPTVEQQCRELLNEDQRKGEKGGGSSNGKSRKKPAKRGKARVEQDSFGCGPQRDPSVTKRLKKLVKKKFTVTSECAESMTQACHQLEKQSGRKGTITNIVRPLLTAKHLTTVTDIPRIEYGDDKKEFTILFTTDELKILESKARVYKISEGRNVTRGAVIEAAFWKAVYPNA